MHGSVFPKATVAHWPCLSFRVLSTTVIQQSSNHLLHNKFRRSQVKAVLMGFKSLTWQLGPWTMLNVLKDKMGMHTTPA